MRFILTLFFFYSILFCQSQTADSFYENKIIKSFSTEQGLLHPNITSIVQDKDGFIWVGSEIGLQRYDGYQFQNYFYDLGIQRNLQNNIVKDLLVDEAGNILVGTWGGGIYSFNPESNDFSDFEFIKQTDTISPRNTIQCITQNRDGSFWIGTNQGLIYYSSKTKQVDLYNNEPKDSKSLSHVWTKQILQCKNGNYVFVCDDGVLNLFRPESKDFKRVSITTANGKGTIPINSVYEYSEQTLLLGTSMGIYLYDLLSGSFTSLKTVSNRENILQKSEIMGLYKEREGKIWVATYYNGLFEIELGIDTGNELNIKTVKSVMSKIVVNDIFTDEQGNVWIATFNNGLKVIINKKLSITSQELETAPVYCIAKGDTNFLWVGTMGGGLYKYNLVTHSYKRYTISSGLSSNYIRSLYVDGSEKLLIGTLNGLNVLDFKSEEVSLLRDEDGILNSEIVFINKDKKGNYWMGSVTNGLVHLDIKNIRVESYVPSGILAGNLPHGSANVRSALFDKQGRLWVGIYGAGLKLFDTEKRIFTKSYGHIPDDENSLKDNFILDLIIDSEDKIWLGSLGGFHQFIPDSEVFINYPMKGGVTDKLVQAILDDNHGAIWISTTNGLKRFEKKTQTFQDLDESDGLVNKVFVNGSKFKDKNGILYFGSWDRKRNVITVNPEAASFNKNEPKLILSDFKIFNKPLDIGGGNSPLQKHISKTKSIRLKHDQTAITIDYVALNFVSPENNRYAYRMDGLEAEWREVGSQRVANYSNLTAGDYTFMVKASNNDDVWTSEPLTLDIKVLPHPLKSKLAYSIYWALFMLLNIWIIWFVKRLNKRQLDMKLLEVERDTEKKLNQFKLQFFTNISHELRTHLTLIVYPINKLLKKGSHSTENKILIDRIDLNVSRLAKLTDEIIDFRKVEQGKTSLAMQKSNIVEFLQEISNLFIPIAEEHKMQFEFQTDQPEIIWCFDQENLKKILFNLLTNAFKYTPDGGSVKLSVELLNPKKGSAEKLRISLADNGIGIEQEHLPYIFDRFFNPSKDQLQHNLQGSSGIGLALVKRLVELQQGTIYVESVLEKGSHFYFDMEKLECLDAEGIISKPNSNLEQYEKWEDILELERSNIQEELVIPNELKSEEVPVILVVDDNKEICLDLNDILKNTYKVFIANDGKQALEIADKENIDIIVSDIMMPVMDGIELCNKLKGELKTSHIPVVLLTAKSGIDNELHGLRTGADAYITKPFNEEKVLLTVGNIINNRKKTHLLFKGEKSEQISEPVINPLDKKLIDKIRKIVNEKLSDSNFSVDELGREAGLSRMHLFRKLKALTGDSPSDLIKKTRLEKSKVLIEIGELSIADIAYDTGFSTPGNFSTTFKKFYGDTPAQCRSKHFKSSSQ
jgi:signal transduction histidine kinase/ligand-binding sensor domain-containing protein/DNA-binding response OmpR family regulator